MKATELRIGNLVFVDAKEGIYDYVNSIYEGYDNCYHIAFKQNRVILKDSNVVPIELSEAFFPSFGFIENPMGVFVLGKIDLERISESQGFGVAINENPIDVEIKYVHQLQNIYHELTKKELLFIESIIYANKK